MERFIRSWGGRSGGSGLVGRACAVACVSTVRWGILRRHEIRSWEKYFAREEREREGCNREWRSRQPEACYDICLFTAAAEITCARFIKTIWVTKFLKGAVDGVRDIRLMWFRENIHLPERKSNSISALCDISRKSSAELLLDFTCLLNYYTWSRRC